MVMNQQPTYAGYLELSSVVPCGQLAVKNYFKSLESIIASMPHLNLETPTIALKIQQN